MRSRLAPALFQLVTTVFFAFLFFPRSYRDVYVQVERSDAPPRVTEHFVFLGDSLTRYQLLAFLHRLRFPGMLIPDFVVSEKVFGSWVSFYENSSSLFDTWCACDCFRPDHTIESSLVDPFTPMRENRFCNVSIEGQATFSLTYIQLFGDTPSMHGTVLPHETHTAKIDEEQVPDKWAYHTVSECLRAFVSELNPKPTHIILGTGAWPHGRIMLELRDTLLAATSLTQNVFWKETPPSQDALQESDGFSLPRDIDRHAESLCQTGLCTYIPFPNKLPSEFLTDSGIPGYWDNLHFSSGELYSFWNNELIKSMKNSSIVMSALCRIFQVFQ